MIKTPAFNDRVERKFEVRVSKSEVATLWRDLSALLKPHNVHPVQEITSVGSVYFDNKDFDLLRFNLLGHFLLFRIRSYEMFGTNPSEISQYWIEVKTANGERRQKKRFGLSRARLQMFLEGRSYDEVRDCIDDALPDFVVPRTLFQELQETLVTMGLTPRLLVLYKRVAFQGDQERLSIDWDLQYFNANLVTCSATSWKYLDDEPAGTSENVIMEIKCIRNEMPDWFSELESRYPIRRREYLKPIEGMDALFRKSLAHHKTANYFRPRIAAYMASSELG